MDDVLKMLQADLRDIKESQSAAVVRLNDIAERMAVLETQVERQAKIESELAAIKEEHDRNCGAKSTILWIISTGVAVAAAIKAFLLN